MSTEMKNNDDSATVSEPTTNDSTSSKERESTFKQTSISSTLISFISSYLLEVIIENRNHYSINKPKSSDVLYSKRIPKLSIEAFLIRTVKYTKMEMSTLVCFFIYLTDFLSKESDFVLCSGNVYRLILGLSVLSVKYHEDILFKNSYYARIGGLETNEMNAIEGNLLKRLDYKMSIEYERYLWTLERILDY